MNQKERVSQKELDLQGLLEIAPIKKMWLRAYQKPSVHLYVHWKPTKRDPEGSKMSIIFGNVTIEDFLKDYPFLKEHYHVVERK